MVAVSSLRDPEPSYSSDECDESESDRLARHPTSSTPCPAYRCGDEDRDAASVLTDRARPPTCGTRASTCADRVAISRLDEPPNNPVVQEDEGRAKTQEGHPQQFATKLLGMDLEISDHAALAPRWRYFRRCVSRRHGRGCRSRPRTVARIIASVQILRK